MDLFVDAHRWKGEGGKKDPITTPLPLLPPWKLSNVSCNDKIWQSYTVPKGDPKSI